MKLRKVLAAVSAAALACTMVVSASAADSYKVGIAGQFDTSVEGNFDEWADTTGYDQTVEAVDGVVSGTYKADFGQTVAFSGNYVGFQTSIPYVDEDEDDAYDYDVELISVKLDGNAVDVTGTIVTAEGYDGGVRINLTNQWNTNITTQPVAADVWTSTPFQTIEVEYSITVAAATEPADDSTAEPTEPADDNADTGAAAGLALAGLALAGAAVVVSKKNK